MDNLISLGPIVLLWGLVALAIYFVVRWINKRANNNK